MRFRTGLIFVVCLLAMAACGGNGGGSAPSPVSSPQTPAEATGFLAVAGARLAVIDVKTYEATDLGVTGGCFAWSPDGRRLAYGGTDGLFVATFPAGTATAVSGLPGSESNCPTTQAWSPDSNRLLFISRAAGEERSSLWLAEVGGDAPRKLVPSTATEGIGSALWLDAGRVLAMTQGEGDVGRILIVDSPTGTVEQAYEPGGILFGVSVRHDGLIAVGVSTLTGSAPKGTTPAPKGNETPPELHGFIVTIDPGKRQMTQLIDGAIEPMWSPDGAYLLAPKSGSHPPILEGGLDLYRADGSGERSLLPDGAARGIAAWTRDGSRLVVAYVDQQAMTVGTYGWGGISGLGVRIAQVKLPDTIPSSTFGLDLSPAGGHMTVMQAAPGVKLGEGPVKILIADLRNGDVRDTGEVGQFAGVAWSPR